jgi:hypothetical protein
MPSSAALTVTGPFDLTLSLEAVACFLPRIGPVPIMPRAATCVDHRSSMKLDYQEVVP